VVATPDVTKLSGELGASLHVAMLEEDVPFLDVPWRAQPPTDRGEGIGVRGAEEGGWATAVPDCSRTRRGRFRASSHRRPVGLWGSPPRATPPTAMTRRFV
jgi:hypothetical protein